MKNSIRLFCCLFFISCGKRFLDVKYDSRLVVPSSIADYQALLDQTYIMNYESCHELAFIGSDEYYLLDGRLTTLTQPYQRNGYIWAQEVYEGGQLNDWNKAYLRILQANLAIEGIKKITATSADQQAWNNVLGNGLFIRAYNHYQLAQLFCKAYYPETASTDPGIPLRLESDINIRPVRSTVAETYQQIIGDLSAAISLLPDLPINNKRPSKAAAYALFAKTYLQMGDFEKAGTNAGLSLQLKDALIDFNRIDVDADTPFPLSPTSNDSNPEIMYFNTILNIPIIIVSRLNVDSALLATYHPNDLRKRANFSKYTNGSNVYKGSYIGGGIYGSYFTGLAVDETVLIRAECLARLGQLQEALEALNYLLKNRYQADGFTPVTALSGTELLKIILLERQKELVLRGVRWEDLRRLNKEPAFRKSLQRKIDGNTYNLPAEDNRWVWPIPQSAVELSGMEQNPR